MVMMKQTPRLYNIFTDPFISGIFEALGDITPSVPWADDIDATTLDVEYFGNISGEKKVSPLVKKMLSNNTTQALTTEQITVLANIIYRLNIENWTKLYNTLDLEYNPISNYDMTETETASGTTGNSHTNTGTVTTSHTGTQTDSDSSQVTGTGTGSVERGIFGFNSSTTSVGDTEDSTTNSTSTTATGSSTRTDNLTDQQTNNLSESDSGTHSNTRTLTRSGNIGVTTSQQMIQSERDLWLWNFIYNVVFPSVDKVLTISTY